MKASLSENFLKENNMAGESWKKRERRSRKVFGFRIFVVGIKSRRGCSSALKLTRKRTIATGIDDRF